MRPVAHAKAKYCYGCRTRGTRIPPPCRRCGSTSLYYSGGLCQRCHKYAPDFGDSCPYCCAWGLFKTGSGVCNACRDWRRRHPGERLCPGCGKVQSLNGSGLCRLCWRRARANSWAADGLVNPEALAVGHQLFISDLEHKLALVTPPALRRWKTRPIRTRSRARPRPRAFRLADHRQLTLFDAVRDSSRLDKAPEPPFPDLAAALEAVVVEHAETYGWTGDLTSAVRRAVRVLLAIQDTPGAPIKASEVALLRKTSLPAGPTMDVLRTAAILEDDDVPAIVTWFESRVAALPDEMASELRVWFAVMREGSSQPPRRRPRADRTIRNHLTSALPVLRGWAGDHASLREIDRGAIHTVLAASGRRRVDTLQGLRSIFRILKARKQIFTDPTSRIFCGMARNTIPMTIAPAQLRESIESPEPTRAALAALLVFHGVRPRQLRHILLTDVRDSRLYVDGRTIPMADHVSAGIAAYLHHRGQRWPKTANPHLFVNQVTANRTGAVTYNWINSCLGCRAQDLRADRILDEVRATDGDVRRICDLFGLSVGAAQRYIDAGRVQQSGAD
ncbi:hypothetical protein A5780_20645 [Nocardia sp. 852002-20019_SCH5090214]|nr:hypothetical protein A5780_20645 [Nocardia sp. 852002-20019_SCH5090214]